MKMTQEEFWDSPLGGACAVFVERCKAIDADPALSATLNQQFDAPGGLTAATIAHPLMVARDKALDEIVAVVATLRFHEGVGP
jgi:hypothetical protein